jgi:alpha-tubulin suppressor-like RCC1 family protein
MHRVAWLLVLTLASITVSCSSDGVLGPPCGIGMPCPSDRITSLHFIPGKDTLLVGDRAQIVVSALDSTGAPVTDVPFTYTSSRPSVATVDQTGVVTALDTGVTVLTIAAGDKKATDSLFVVSAAFIALDAGAETSCALQQLGRSYCWGLNDVGQLGFGLETTCFGENLGSLRCSIYPGNVGPALRLASISAGDSLACGIAIDGSAMCWGDNSVGQLGNGTTVSSTIPTTVFGAARYSTVAVGGAHACAISTSGISYCWGNDSLGQLGDARLIHSTTPIPVVDGAQTPMLFASLTAGYMHTCGLTAAGVAYCWGDNSRGQLGTGGSLTGPIDTPALVAGGLTFSSITASLDTSRSDTSQRAGALRSSFTCGLVSGSAYCWGFGIVASRTPTPVGGGISFTQLSAGGAHVCGLTASGAAYCWGNDNDDQLGNGPGVSSRAVPVAVSGGLTFTSISAGRLHTCATATDGLTYCWGSDVFGALGNTYQAAFRGLPQAVAQPTPQAQASRARDMHATLKVAITR